MENLNQAKTKENIETPDFLFENFEIETQEMINKRNHQEIIRYLNKILLLSKTSNYSNGLVHKAAQLIDKIFKNCLPDLEDPNRNLVLLQNVKLVLSQHPGVLVPQRCSLLSNLACTYRRLGKPHSAKKYLEKALEMMKNNREVLIDKASIYLNFCAVFSNLKRHKDALDYGTLAVQYAQDDMLNLCNDLPESEQIQKITVLAISYYNLAVEQEYLNRNDDACEWYNKALKFLQKHQETQNLIEISNSCKENLNSLKERGVKPLQRPQSSYENSKFRPVSAKSTVSSASKKAFDREKIYKPPLKKPKAFPVKIPQSANIFETRFPLEKKPGTFEQLKSQLEYETKFKMPNITDKTLKKNEIFSSEKRFMNVLSSEESKRNISIDENKRIVKTRPKSTRSHHRLMKSPYRLSSKHQPNIDNILVKLKVVKPTSPKKNDIEKILVIESQRDVTERINKPIKHSYPFLKDQDLSSICVDDSLDMTDMSLHFRSPTPKLDHEKQLKQAATKIQSIFRGNRDRAKTALRRKNSVKSEILYKSGKKINGIYYMITIYKVLGQYKLILANIADPDQRFEFEINNEGAQNPDDIIRSISHKDSRPYLDQTPINSLNHVQRIAKNISGKNIVLDCFASKHGENLLIKAKDIKSEQEYSLKLQNQYPFSPSKVVNEFKNRIIPHLLITNQSLEFINKDLKENLIQEFKLILAKSIYLNQEKSQISIMKSALCIKITVIGESLNEDLILTLDEIKNRLNILDEDLETIIEKLVNSIENNNALKFLTTNAVEVNSLSETKDETEFIGFVFEDNPQATHLLPETPNKAPKSIWRNIDGTNYLLEGLEDTDKMELKAIFLHDKTKILTKNYTKIELKDLYERDVTIDEVLIGITIKDDKIFLHKELKLNSSEDLIYVTYRFIAGKDHKISVYLIKNNEDITDDDVLRIEVYNKHILADKFTLGLKETADYLCLPIEKAKEICIHIAWSMLVEKNSVIVVDKNAVYHDLDHSAAMIQSIYKGHLVRALYNPVIQKQPGEISIKKTLLIPGDSSSYTTIITLYPKYIYINATNDENNLKVLLKNEIMSGYPADFHKKDIIEQHIIPRLHIINKNGKKELHGIKEFEMVINK